MSADGRVRDITTGNIDYNNESSVYYILNPNNEELIVKSLKEAADIFEFVNIDEEEKIKKIFEYILQWLRIFLPKRPEASRLLKKDGNYWS